MPGGREERPQKWGRCTHECVRHGVCCKARCVTHKSYYERMRIDAHQHFWEIGRLIYSWMPSEPSPLCRTYLPSDLQPVLETHRFDGSVVVQAHHSLDEARWLLQLAGENDS